MVLKQKMTLMDLILCLYIYHPSLCFRVVSLCKLTFTEKGHLYIKTPTRLHGKRIYTEVGKKLCIYKIHEHVKEEKKCCVYSSVFSVFSLFFSDGSRLREVTMAVKIIRIFRILRLLMHIQRYIFCPLFVHLIFIINF